MPLERDDESGKESLARRLGVGAATLGASVGTGMVVVPHAYSAGLKINKKVLSDFANQTKAGVGESVLTPEEIAAVEKKLKVSPNVDHFHVNNKAGAHYSTWNMRTYDPNMRPTGYTAKARGYLKGVEAEYAARRAAGQPMPKSELTKRINDELLKHPSEGAIFSNKKDIAHLHEAGHATGLMHIPENAGKIRRAIGNAWGKGTMWGLRALGQDAAFVKAHPRLGRAVATFPGAAAAARQAHKEMTGEDSLALRGADYLGKGAIGIKLLEEAQASARPLYHIFKDYGFKKGLKAGRHLGTAFMTYAAPAIGSQIIAPLAVKAGFKLGRFLNRNSRNGEPRENEG